MEFIPEFRASYATEQSAHSSCVHKSENTPVTLSSLLFVPLARSNWLWMCWTTMTTGLPSRWLLSWRHKSIERWAETKWKETEAKQLVEDARFTICIKPYSYKHYSILV